MRVPSIDSAAILAALDKRDPETLVGPALCLLTWMARDVPAQDVPHAEGAPARLCECRVAHLGALAAHPAVSLELRLTAGALAIEHRREAAAREG